MLKGNNFIKDDFNIIRETLEKAKRYLESATPTFNEALAALSRLESNYSEIPNSSNQDLIKEIEERILASTTQGNMNDKTTRLLMRCKDVLSYNY